MCKLKPLRRDGVTLGSNLVRAHLIPGNSSSDRACWRTEDAGLEMTESKCHPEKRLRLIVPSLISSWSSQEHLIWRLCGNALLHSNGSPSLTPTTSCFPRLKPPIIDKIIDKCRSACMTTIRSVCDMALLSGGVPRDTPMFLTSFIYSNYCF